MLRALADGTRRRILAMIWRKELAAGEIAENFSLTRPAVSQHLRVLLISNLIKLRRSGTRRLYRANPQAMLKLRTEMASLWDEGLSRLKRASEADEAFRKGK